MAADHQAIPRTEVEPVLVALADGTRREILRLILAGGGQQSATAVAASLPVSRQAVVKHLGVLEQAKLVVPRRVGREVRYGLVPGPLVATADWLKSQAAAWSGTTDADPVPAPPAATTPPSADRPEQGAGETNSAGHLAPGAPAALEAGLDAVRNLSSRVAGILRPR